jgi:hypothetical protein
MGFLKKVFGGKEKSTPPARRTPPPTVRPKPIPTARPAPTPEASAPAVPVENMDVKGLLRALGVKNRETREAAALRLMDLHDRSAIRPLMNAYLNYGDPGVLTALSVFGAEVTGPATSEAFDLSVVGPRRARLMDVLGFTRDENALNVVRDFADDRDLEVHVRASTALARLSDLSGVDRLSDDLQQAADVDRRTRALGALHELGDLPSARAAMAGHVDRYLAEGGAIPREISVTAPALADPDLSMITFIVEEIKHTSRDMVLVIGSGAGDMARSRQTDFRRDLAGHPLFLLTPETPPEQQMSTLEEARDVASSSPEHTVLVIGVVPSPHDARPLRHFLTTGTGGSKYTVKIIYVDPHEAHLLMDWWHYVDERAEIETEFEVVLSASVPGKSAISEEEYLIYTLAPEARKPEFARALLAHL